MGRSLISNILKTLMFKKNVNTSQLARDLNLPQQTLQRIVSGTSPNPHGKTLKPIADFFDINLEQLRGKIPLPESITDMGFPQASRPKPREIPIVEWNSIENYLNDPSSCEINEHVFAEEGLPEKSFAVTLQDSSMEPYFPKNSLLILDHDKPIKDRCFVLANISEGHMLIFRQLLIDGEHQYLKALNPDLNSFPMRLLRGDDQILGVMIEFRHRYEEL